MNTKIANPSRKDVLTPPGFGVRALCAAFLSAPIVLGAFLTPSAQTFVHDLFTFVHLCSR